MQKNMAEVRESNMDNEEKKPRKWSARVCAESWIVVALAVLLSFLMAFHTLETGGVTVNITPQKENSLTVDPGTVSIRGAIIDEAWYDPEALYSAGNWQLDAERHIYSSVSSEDIILKIP